MDIRLENVEKKVGDLDRQVGVMEQKVDKMDARVETLSKEVENLNLRIDKDVIWGINAIGEGHSDLARNLENAIESMNWREQTNLRLMHMAE